MIYWLINFWALIILHLILIFFISFLTFILSLFCSQWSLSSSSNSLCQDSMLSQFYGVECVNWVILLVIISLLSSAVCVSIISNTLLGWFFIVCWRTLSRCCREERQTTAVIWTIANLLGVDTLFCNH